MWARLFSHARTSLDGFDHSQFGECSTTISCATPRVLAVKLLPELALSDTPRSKNATVKRRGERKETVTDKDLYRAILSVLQSHFDSTEVSRPASQAELNDAVVNNSRNADRAMLAHQIGQDAVNDWLSAKVTPAVWSSFGMMRD